MVLMLGGLEHVTTEKLHITQPTIHTPQVNSPNNGEITVTLIIEYQMQQ